MLEGKARSFHSCMFTVMPYVGGPSGEFSSTQQKHTTSAFRNHFRRLCSEHVKVLLHKGSEWTLVLYISESLLNPFLIILIRNRSRSISSTLVYDIHFDIARIQSQINRCNSFLSVREKPRTTPRHIHLGLKAKNLGEDAVISESIYSIAEHKNISPGTARLSACFSWRATLVCTNWFAFLEKFHVCSGAPMKSMNKLPHPLLFWLHDAESIRTWVKIDEIKASSMPQPQD